MCPLSCPHGLCFSCKDIYRKFRTVSDEVCSVADALWSLYLTCQRQAISEPAGRVKHGEVDSEGNGKPNAALKRLNLKP